jgi:hypothetical protein
VLHDARPRSGDAAARFALRYQQDAQAMGRVDACDRAYRRRLGAHPTLGRSGIAMRSRSPWNVSRRLCPAHASRVPPVLVLQPVFLLYKWLETTRMVHQIALSSAEENGTARPHHSVAETASLLLTEDHHDHHDHDIEEDEHKFIDLLKRQGDKTKRSDDEQARASERKSSSRSSAGSSASAAAPATDGGHTPHRSGKKHGSKHLNGGGKEPAHRKKHGSSHVMRMTENRAQEVHAVTHTEVTDIIETARRDIATVGPAPRLSGTPRLSGSDTPRGSTAVGASPRETGQASRTEVTELADAPAAANGPKG